MGGSAFVGACKWPGMKDKGLTGKRAWRSRRVGRKLSSAFRTVTLSPDGDSPWRLSIKFSLSISAKMG